MAVEDVVSALNRNQPNRHPRLGQGSSKRLALKVRHDRVRRAMHEQERRSGRRDVGDRAGGRVRVLILPADQDVLRRGEQLGWWLRGAIGCGLNMRSATPYQSTTASTALDSSNTPSVPPAPGATRG